VSKIPTRLTFSYTGYETTTIDATSGKGVDMGLSEGSQLNEVIVTALGIERATKSLSYSAQKVGGDNINTIRDQNFLNSLSGKVAGAVVTGSSSGVGGASRIVLRGNRSITQNNDALMVVDGVVIDNSKFGQVGNDFGGYNGSDGAANINPDDIESITVLKGSNASALYGANAANGVLIITTKKGKAGKITTDVNSGFTVENAFILPNFQNEYGQGSAGTFAPRSGNSWGPKMTGQGIDKDWLGRGGQSLNAQPNNVRDFFENAVSLNNSFGITGGTDKLSTYISYANNRANGIIQNNKLNRHTLNLRINSQITDRLSADGKLTYINQSIDGKPKAGEENGHIVDMYFTPRNISAQDLEDNYDKEIDGVPSYWTSSSIYQNPYWMANKTSQNERRNRVLALGSLKYEITSWLSAQGRVSMDRYNDQIENIFSEKTILFAQGGGSYGKSNANVSLNVLDFLLSGKHELGSKFSLNYNLGTSRQQNKYDFVGNFANGLSVPNKFDLSFAKALNTSTAASEVEIQSVYGTAQLGFNNYLFLDVTSRQDWSSTLPSPHSYFFPSVGLTAVVSEMAKMPDWISFGKVRVSHAITGNGVGFSRLLPIYEFRQGGTNGYIFRDSRLNNPELKPELTTSTELGLDWRFFHNRFGIDLTLYKTNTRNQELSIQLPLPTGYSTKFINAGNIENKGIELQLSATPIKGKNLSWDAQVNFARNINKVVELFENDPKKTAVISGSYGRSADVIVAPGGSVGDLIAYRWANTKVDGAYSYVEGAGDRLVDVNGKPIPTKALEVIGNYNPKYTLGFSNTVNYKNFSLGFLLDGRFGGIMVSGTEANLAFYGLSDYTTANRDTWTVGGVKEGGGANDKAINAEQFWQTVSGGRYSWGEFFAYDATNVRLRELSLGYNFKLKSTAIKALKVSLIGRNLAMLYRGSAILDIPGVPTRKLPFDPDMNLSASNWQGVDYGNMPSTRMFGVNMKLSF
jgi:TonB-linked SusC/RagA family outer membrane protein